jgi:hypothetical protein
MQDADAPPCDRYDTSVEEDEAAQHLEARMNRVEARIDRLEARLDRLERTVRWWIMVQMVWSTAGIALMVYLTRGGR